MSVLRRDTLILSFNISDMIYTLVNIPEVFASDVYIRILHTTLPS